MQPHSRRALKVLHRIQDLQRCLGMRATLRWRFAPLRAEKMQIRAWQDGPAADGVTFTLVQRAPSQPQ